MKSLIKKFNDMKIQSKLIFSFLLAVIIPLLIVGTFLTNELRTTAMNKAIEQSAANVDRVKKRTAETLETAIDIANDITLDPHLKRLVNTEYTSTQQVVLAYREYQGFDNYLNNYEEISNIRMYVNNPSMLNNWGFIPATKQTKDLFWYESAEKANGLFGWYYMPDETKNDRNYLSLVRKINYFDYQTSSILVINVNPENLYPILNQEQSPIMIVDENNYVVVSNRNDFIGKNLEDILDTNPKNIIPNQSFTGTINGEKSEILVDLLLPDMSQNKLKFVSVTPKHFIMKDANNFLLNGLFVIGISIVIAVILIYIIAQLISRRIITLGSQINQVAEGNLDAPIQVDGTDEIGQLSKQLDYMVRNIKELIVEVEKMHLEKNILEKRQQEIKLKMMASQINPHFLFNALESIRMKAHLQGEKDISGVVKQLGKLMRKSISVTGEMIFLKNELEMVRSYLEIQKFRYEDRLNFELNIDPLSENTFIQPLIIQPLVENAVIHGLEDMGKGGKVIIETKVCNQNLHVRVQDNGVGISKEELQNLHHSLHSIEDNQENRIGLMNVHQRLTLTFGEESGLVIESEPGKGTCISFMIPAGGKDYV